MRRAITLILAVLICLPAAASRHHWAPPAPEETRALQAIKNNTLIESPEGQLSNGRGPSIFVGRTGQPEGSIRRGLIAFDVAAGLPRGVRIISVKLALNMRLAAGGARPAQITLHRALRDWGEGNSNSVGGRGAQAEDGDATWIHTFYPKKFWARHGGDYTAAVSAAQSVGDVGTYEWTGPGMVRDVRRWLAAPRISFGWLILGDESRAATAKVFDSRHSSGEDAHPPQLTVTFTRSAGRKAREAG